MRLRGAVSVRRLMGIVAAVAAMMALTSGSRTVYYSCHLCHNRKHVASRLFLGFPVSWHEAVDTRFLTAPDHRHSWWRYARGTGGFPSGSSGACSDHRYVDGSIAPDGAR